VSDSHPDTGHDLDQQVGQIADEFALELDQGGQPSIDGYVRRYPELAHQLRQVLPALKLMRAAASEATSGRGVEVGPTISPGGVIGDYRLIRELGRGGMGIVYLAQQISLGRRVALKVLPTLAALDARQLQRFKNEAQAAAQLHHSHIVPVYGVGNVADVHFYAMQAIDGQTLASLIHDAGQKQALKARGESRPREGESGFGSTPAASCRIAATLALQAAQALEHAHEVGILHRDIKPANLLIEKSTHLWITDFGLARLRGSSDLTLSGDLVGTVRYMSPEQALGRHALVDQRTDVYSLGITLYELLTLEPAFDGVDRVALLHQVAFEEPKPLREANRAIPADLETIVLKAIAKNREERYHTARDFADDLRRFLENRPILARRPTAWQRARKWSQRHKAVVATAAICSVAALVGLELFDHESRLELREKQKETISALEMATARHLEAEKARGELAQSLVDTFTSTGLTAGDRGEFGQAVLWFAEAARNAAAIPVAEPAASDGVADPVPKPPGDPERVLANRQRVRFWSRRLPIPVMAMSLEADPRDWRFRPHGEQLLILTRSGKCLLLDPEADKTLVVEEKEQFATSISWSSDGQRYVLGRQDGTVDIFAYPEGKPLARIQHAGAVSALAFSADGQLLAIGGLQTRVWDTRVGRFVTPILEHPRPVRHAAFNTKGTRLITACTDGLARVFAIAKVGETTSTNPLFAPCPNLGSAGQAEDPLQPLLVDGERGLVVRDRNGARWIDVESGKEIRRILNGEVFAIEPSADGQRFVISSYQNAQVFESNPPKLIGPALLHKYRVFASFRPDGQSLLTGSSYAVQEWSVPDGRQLTPLNLNHQDAVTGLLCSPGGRFFATSQLDGLVRIWSYPGAAGCNAIPIDSAMTFVRPSPDGQKIMPAGAGWWNGSLRRTRVFDVKSGKPLGPFLDAGGLLTDGAMSPDGATAVTVASTLQIPADRYVPLCPESQGGVLRRWNWRTGQLLGQPVSLPGDPRNVAYSPDGSRIAVLCGGGQVLLLNSSGVLVHQSQVRGEIPWSDNVYTSIQFSPDGRLFATSGLVGNVQLWDASTGESWGEPLLHAGNCRSIEFSPDGAFLVSASRDRSARVWDVASGKLAANELTHPAELFGARFSPDGRLVVTACSDGMARVWSWRDGKLAAPAFRHPDVVCAAVFSPDGKTILVRDRRGQARLWEVHTGKALTPSLRAGAEEWFPLSAFFTADGQFGVTAAANEPIQPLSFSELVESDDLSDERYVEAAELLSGYRLEAEGVTGLTSQEWLQRWRALREQGKLPSLLRSPEAKQQLRNRGQEFQLVANYAGAAWCFQRLVELDPLNAQWHDRLATAYQGSLRRELTVSEFSKAIELDPSSVVYLEHRAAAYADLNDKHLAIADYSDLLRQEPRSARAHYERGNLYLKVHANTHAIADFRKALELDPTFHLDGSIWLQIAEAQRSLAQVEAARQSLAQADAFFAREERSPDRYKLTGVRRERFLTRRSATERYVNRPLPPRPKP
jgi:WD40 repeat protein/serine/threonine protein kinase